MGEPGVEAFAIGAVAVQVKRYGLVLVFATGHQADRHTRAVGGGCPKAVADIGIGVKRAEHRRFFQNFLLAIAQCQLAHLGWPVERFIAQAYAGADELKTVLHVQAVGGIGQLHTIGGQALGVHFDDRQAAFAQAQGQCRGIEADAFKHDVVAMGYQPLPLLAQRCLAQVGRLEQGKVDAVLIAAHKPGPHAIELAVVRVVFVVLDPRRHAGKGFLRMLGVERPGFAGGLAVEQQDQLAFGTGAVAVQEEAPVGFFENRLATFTPEAMAQQFVRAVGVVQFGEEQRLVIVGPGHAAVAIVERQLFDGAAGQVLDVQGVDFIAAGIEAVSQALVVGADVEGTEGQEAAVGQRVGVQQQLFPAFVDAIGVVSRARAAVMAWIFLTCRGAAVVEVRAPGRGHRQISLLNPALDLFEQLFAQLRLVGQLRRLVGILVVQVSNDFRAVTLLEPGIGISAFGFAGNRGAGSGGVCGHAGISWLGGACALKCVYHKRLFA
ncbi:hypothetical protein D3C76_841230 [compost metagenome]